MLISQLAPFYIKYITFFPTYEFIIYTFFPTLSYLIVTFFPTLFSIAQHFFGRNFVLINTFSDVTPFIISGHATGTSSICKVAEKNPERNHFPSGFQMNQTISYIMNGIFLIYRIRGKLSFSFVASMRITNTSPDPSSAAALCCIPWTTQKK